MVLCEDSKQPFDKEPLRLNWRRESKSGDDPAAEGRKEELYLTPEEQRIQRQNVVKMTTSQVVASMYEKAMVLYVKRAYCDDARGGARVAMAEAFLAKRLDALKRSVQESQEQVVERFDKQLFRLMLRMWLMGRVLP